MPQTERVPVSNEVLSSAPLQKRLEIRTMPADEFIEKHASGTLRKNKRLGFSWREQYLHERVAYEFGWEFKLIQASRITYNDPFTEGDNKSITEAGWHIERYINLFPFPEDKFECKYIIVEFSDGKREEGVGIIVRRTSCAWIPKGYIVYAIVSEYKKDTEEFEPAQNPF